MRMTGVLLHSIDVDARMDACSYVALHTRGTRYAHSPRWACALFRSPKRMRSVGILVIVLFQFHEIHLVT